MEDVILQQDSYFDKDLSKGDIVVMDEELIQAIAQSAVVKEHENDNFE